MQNLTKKGICGLLTLAMCGAVACAPISSSEPQSADTLTRAIALGTLLPGSGTESGPLSLNTTLITDDYEFTIKTVDTVYIDNRQFLLVDTILTNVSQDDWSFDYTRVSAYADNEKLDQVYWDNFFSNAVRPNLAYYADLIESGRTERGFFIFEYAREFTELEVIIDGVHYLIRRDQIGGPTLFITIPAADYYVVEEAAETEETEETVPEETVPAETEAIDPATIPMEEWETDEGSGLLIEPQTGWLYDEDTGLVFYPNTPDLMTIENALAAQRGEPVVIEMTLEPEETEED